MMNQSSVPWRRQQQRRRQQQQQQRRRRRRGSSSSGGGGGGGGGGGAAAARECEWEGGNSLAMCVCVMMQGGVRCTRFKRGRGSLLQLSTTRVSLSVLEVHDDEVNQCVNKGTCCSSLLLSARSCPMAFIISTGFLYISQLLR